MGEVYKPNSMGAQNGVDREGSAWVGFDYSLLDDPGSDNDPAFHTFMVALDYLAHKIAAEMFFTTLARHDFRQIKAYEMHMRSATDRQIGTGLGVDHKTAQRWYADVAATIRGISSLGRGAKQDGPIAQAKARPTKGYE